MFLIFFRLIRFHQYSKNILVFAPLFFSGMIFNQEKLINSIYAFIFFSMAASSIYILNDIIDIHEDRQHKTKKNRPIASGQVKKNTALIVMIILVLSSMLGSSLIFPSASVIIIGYIILNILYSTVLKHMPIIDILIIAIGFVLRVYIGIEVIKVETSHWIILITFLLALFLGLAKRRDDVLNSAKGRKVRRNIDGYNLDFINSSMSIMASIVIVAYIMYTTSQEVTERLDTNNLYFTVFFVILGIFRYLQISFVEENSGSPTLIFLNDKFLKITIFLWLITFGIIIYS